MLMRTDPFRDFDRLAQQVFGTPARPAAMPIDAYRKGDEFIVQFDVPGVDASSIDLTVEKNVLSVHAERRRNVAQQRRRRRGAGRNVRALVARHIGNLGHALRHALARCDSTSA